MQNGEINLITYRPFGKQLTVRSTNAPLKMAPVLASLPVYLLDYSFSLSSFYSISPFYPFYFLNTFNYFYSSYA